ncbi:MAG: glucan phosphoethanolaminetransferase (alkaline phosphatase superfamily) [Vicingaceae bacterium]|jgi:glucan phosphoethanolaminetransferase (alkaline phosphatase superfamily)
MPQVLRPNDFTKTNESAEFRTFELSKQVVVSSIAAILLGIWLIITYLNDGLFFKDAAICSSIIFFLVFIKSRSVKKEGVK